MTDVRVSEAMPRDGRLYAVAADGRVELYPLHAVKEAGEWISATSDGVLDLEACR